MKFYRIQSYNLFYDALPVVIGSDFKTCIDPISATRASIPWRLNHFVEAVPVACFSLGSISYSWVYRKANISSQCSHELAKWSRNQG